MSFSEWFLPGSLLPCLRYPSKINVERLWNGCTQFFDICSLSFHISVLSRFICRQVSDQAQGVNPWSSSLDPWWLWLSRILLQRLQTQSSHFPAWLSLAVNLHLCSHEKMPGWDSSGLFVHHNYKRNLHLIFVGAKSHWLSQKVSTYGVCVWMASIKSDKEEILFHQSFIQVSFANNVNFPSKILLVKFSWSCVSRKPQDNGLLLMEFLFSQIQVYRQVSNQCLWYQMLLWGTWGVCRSLLNSISCSVGNILVHLLPIKTHILIHYHGLPCTWGRGSTF